MQGQDCKSHLPAAAVAAAVAVAAAHYFPLRSKPHKSHLVVKVNVY